MPLAIWVIGFAIFAQGTSELMVAGLLPEMAAELGVSIPQAGGLISSFAVGMLIGAPVLAVLTLRWRRRPALLTFLATFVLAHVLSALTESYGVLLVLRFAAAFAYAGFWAVGSSTAMAMTAPQRRGRAMSIVAGGLTVAIVLGLPAGTWLGHRLGWRSAFWAVALLCTAAASAIVAVLPAPRPRVAISLREELRGLRPPRLWLSYAMTASATCALLGTFTYLAAMLPTTIGLDPAWVPMVLLCYGLGALLGITAGGRAADLFPRAVLGLGFTCLVLVLLLLALTARRIEEVVPLVFLLGLLGFLTNPALSSRYLAIAPGSPTLSISGNISAFNLGIMLGPWLGGLALAAGHGYRAVPATGAVFACLALLLWGWDLSLAGRRRAEAS